MFERELMMAGLKRQKLILEELIQTIEKKSELCSEDRVHYDQKTRLVAANLKKLRKIKDHYPSFEQSEFSLDRH
jgi:DNA transposition AAA+ family ATPase